MTFTSSRGRQRTAAVRSTDAKRSVLNRGTAMQSLSLCASLCLAGCNGRAELISVREGMDRATVTIRQQHKEWAAKLAAGQQAELPALTPADHRAILKAHQEYEDLVSTSRAQDGTSAQMKP